MSDGHRRTPVELSRRNPMIEQTTLRIINDPPLAGPRNMARDEALLEGIAEKTSPATLRLYQWATPTISLGYFQPYSEYEALPPPAGSLPVVRRLTGGGAILHDLEMTYSIVLPAKHPLLQSGANHLYQLAHDGIRASLTALGLFAEPCGHTDTPSAQRGPFFCFARRHRHDLLLGENKIVGSAQRRRSNAVLQHGSIILGNRFPQQETARHDLPLDQSMISIRNALATAIANAMDMSPIDGEWSPQERTEAQTLVDKYSDDLWNRRV